MRVYTYPTSLFGHSPSIEDISNHLERWLINCCSGFDQYVIVAHSMGGIVAKEYILSILRRGQASEMKVTRLFLIATPNTGSDLARWAGFVSPRNAQLKAIRGVDSELLERQLRDWQARVLGEDRRLPDNQKRIIDTTALYGTADQVVDRSSARDRFSHAIAILGRGHSDIVKPERPDDIVVGTIVTEVLGSLSENVGTRPGESPRARIQRRGHGVSLAPNEKARFTLSFENTGSVAAVVISTAKALEFVKSPFLGGSEAEKAKAMKSVEDRLFARLSEQGTEGPEPTSEVPRGMRLLVQVTGPTLVASDFRESREFGSSGAEILRGDQMLLVGVVIRYRDRGQLKRVEYCRYIEHVRVLMTCFGHNSEP